MFYLLFLVQMEFYRTLMYINCLQQLISQSHIDIFNIIDVLCHKSNAYLDIWLVSYKMKLPYNLINKIRGGYETLFFVTDLFT